MEVSELKSLLSEILGEDIILKDISVSNLLPPGENYTSSILDIEAKIQNTFGTDSTTEKRNNGQGVMEGEERLRLIAKVPAKRDELHNVLPEHFIFTKEIFFYEEVFPRYRELMNEAVLECDIAAQYYGSKILAKDDNDFSEFKGCIVLKNLKTSGYYTGNRQKGVDMEHTKLAFARLAVFHALGIAMKTLKPTIFEGFNKYCKNLLPDPFEQFDVMIEDIYKKFREDDILQQYMPKILARVKTMLESYSSRSEGPWFTIVHMDFWVNNMMFHRTEDVVDDIKFVDFQTYCMGYPARDVFHFLFTSVNFEIVPMEAIDELIDFYYERFMNALKLLLKPEEINFAEFSRDLFDKQLADAAPFELLPVIITNKVIMLDLKEVNGDQNDRMALFLTQVGDPCINKMRKVIAYFDDKRWI